MKNALKLTVLLLMLTSISGRCQRGCKIDGGWMLAGTRTPQGEVCMHDRIFFSNDSVSLASGFYYPIIDQNNFEEWKSERYPFIYYGSKEKYKIVGDSIYLYSTPYGDWEALKITCNESGELRLIGEKKSWVLTREEPQTKQPKAKYAMRYIKAHIYEFEGVGNYAINYQVTYSKDDKLIYQQLSEKDLDHSTKTFQLKLGAFNEICRGFDHVDVTQIASIYEASF